MLAVYQYRSLVQNHSLYNGPFHVRVLMCYYLSMLLFSTMKIAKFAQIKVLLEQKTLYEQNLHLIVSIVVLKSNICFNIKYWIFELEKA